MMMIIIIICNSNGKKKKKKKKKNVNKDSYLQIDFTFLTLYCLNRNGTIIILIGNTIIARIIILNIIGMKRLYTLCVLVDGVNRRVERGLCRKRMVLSCCKEDDDRI